MRKLIYLIVLLSGIVTGQNLSEGNLQLLEKIKSEKSKRSNRIEQFLSKNPQTKLDFKKKKKNYSLFDVKGNLPIYLATDNLNAAKGTKTIKIQPGGELNLNLSGENATVGVWDIGVAETTHDEFLTESGTKVETEDLMEISDHATHVTGTIAAIGSNSAALGMAFGAAVKSYDADDVDSEIIYAANDATNPIYFSNHSYGFYIYNDDNEQVLFAEDIGSYNGYAQQWDQISFENKNLLMVSSAGNSGLTSYEGGMLLNIDKLNYIKTAKNNLVVANANPAFNPLTQQLTGFPINSSSSQGPTDDLRVKPDIAGDGTNVFSSVMENEYDYYSGTSMASPNVCGSLVFVHEHYTNTIGNIPKAATIKALACHTAADDSTNVGPDPYFGWGLLDAASAAQLISDTKTGDALITEKRLIQAGTFTMDVTVGNSDNLSVSLSWTDPAGPLRELVANNPDPVLVNDLDVKVTKGDETFLPWRLVLTDDNVLNENGDNVVDNYEKIDIDLPEPGIYTISVSHKGDLVNTSQSPLVRPKYQDYSLIISGNELSFPLSLKQQNSQEVYIYPNPVTDGLINIYGLKKATEVSVINIMGQTVWIGEAKNRIAVSHLENGLYFMKIKGAENYIAKFMLMNN